MNNNYYLLKCLLLLIPCVVSAQDDGYNRYLDTQLGPRWTDNEHFDSTILENTEWWRMFDDPLLDSLVTVARANNYNALMAARRVTVARNTMKAATSSYYPEISLNIGYNKGRSSGEMYGKNGASTHYDYWSGSVSASWEIDIFGKIAGAVKEKKSLWQASRADYAAVMLSLEAQVVTSYIQVKAWQAQWNIANAHSEQQLRIVKMTENRFEAGLASMLDVTQARTLYYSTIASIPGLESSIIAGINALGVLLGNSADNLHINIPFTGKLPDYNQMVAVGIPMDLLRRRPDVVEAEKQLDSYAAALGIARKDYLPSLTLTGSIGTASRSTADIFKHDGLTYSVVPTLSWTIFDGLARKYAVANAKEQLEMGIENYNMTIITAVEEVDNAITAYLKDLQYISLLEKVVTNAEQSVTLAVDRYKNGLTPFSDVVNAQMNFLEYQNTMITAQGDALTSIVSLCKALGGGWNVDMIQ
jgi:NodT family efflux transporter outer membrane factor (OMF) lipoprotein